VLSAPWPVAGYLVRGAPLLTHLRVGPPFPIPETGEAIRLLERLGRAVALRLQAWDDEVLLAATRCLPGCEVLEVWYHDAGPSEVRLSLPFPSRSSLSFRPRSSSPLVT
jgi:hypothetical protein